MHYSGSAQADSKCNGASSTCVTKTIVTVSDKFKITAPHIEIVSRSHDHTHRNERGRSLVSRGMAARESRHSRPGVSNVEPVPGRPKPSVSPLAVLRARSYHRGSGCPLPLPAPHTPSRDRSSPVSFAQPTQPDTVSRGLSKNQRSRNTTPLRQPRSQPSYLNDTVASAARRKLSQPVEQEPSVGAARLPPFRRCSSVTRIQRTESSRASCRSATHVVRREGISLLRPSDTLHETPTRMPPQTNSHHVRVSPVLSRRKPLDASSTADTASQKLKAKDLTELPSLSVGTVPASSYVSCPIYPSPRSLGFSLNLLELNKLPKSETSGDPSSPTPSPTARCPRPPTLLEAHFKRPSSPPKQLYSERKHRDMYPICEPHLPAIQRQEKIMSSLDDPTSSVHAPTAFTPQHTVQARPSAMTTRCSTARSKSVQETLPQPHRLFSAHPVSTTHSTTEQKPTDPPSSSPSSSRVPPTDESKESSPPNLSASPYPWAVVLHTHTDPNSLGPLASVIQFPALQPPQNQRFTEEDSDKDVSASQSTTQCCQYLEFDELPPPPSHLDPHTLQTSIFRALHGPEEAWKVSFDALTQIQCLAKHDGQRLLIDTPILEENIEAIAQCVLSLRSGLSRNAVLTIDTLIRCIPWGLERFLSQLIPPLLSRVALTSQRFVATLAFGALERLCEQSTASLALLSALCAQPLSSRGRDVKNAAQNQKKAVLVKMCLEKLTAHASLFPGGSAVHAFEPRAEAAAASTNADGLFHKDTLAAILLSLSLLLEDRLSSTRKNAKDAILLLFKAYQVQAPTAPTAPTTHHAFTELLKQALLLTGDDTYAIKRHTRFLREVDEILKVATPD